MVKCKRSDSDTTFREVQLDRLTSLSGGLLKKPMVIATRTFPGANGEEFVQLKKGEQWLINAAVGPMERQRGLQRTKLVEDIMTAAFAAAKSSDVADKTTPPDVTPPPHDPMADLCYEDSQDTPPALAGDDAEETLEETPKKKSRSSIASGLVRVNMPAKSKERYPDSTEMRTIQCYVFKTTRPQIWISTDDVPWLLRVLHDQASLGGVPLLSSNEDHTSPALAGNASAAEPTGNARAAEPTGNLCAATPTVRWDFVVSAWVAEGKQLKPDDVSAEDAAAIGVGADAWSTYTYEGKKDVAHKVVLHWLGQ